jgi:hypothetical protein
MVLYTVGTAWIGCFQRNGRQRTKLHSLLHSLSLLSPSPPLHLLVTRVTALVPSSCLTHPVHDVATAPAGGLAHTVRRAHPQLLSRQYSPRGLTAQTAHASMSWFVSTAAATASRAIATATPAPSSTPVRNLPHRDTITHHGAEYRTSCMSRPAGGRIDGRSQGMCACMPWSHLKGRWVTAETASRALTRASSPVMPPTRSMTCSPMIRLLSRRNRNAMGPVKFWLMNQTVPVSSSTQAIECM